MYLATEQVFHGRLVEGERALWALVLSTAIEDLACCSDGGLPQKGVRWERRALALEWITNSDDIHVGSFQFTCDALDLDATAVRERILRADQQRFAKKLKPAPEETKPCSTATTGFNEHRAPADSPVMNGAIPSVTIADVDALQTNTAKQRKRGEHMSNSNGQGHIDWLKGQASRLQEQLAAAEAAFLRLKPVVANIQSVITALADPAGSGADPKENGSAKPKRTVEPALARRPPYEAVPINDALTDILKASDRPIHHDQLTRSVFNVSDGREFERAKSSVTARLCVGAKSGLFKALGGGRYQIANGAMQSPG